MNWLIPFNYLGMLFSYTGNFAMNHEYLFGKAVKAMNALLSKCKGLSLKLKVLCQSLGLFIGFILSNSAVYGKVVHYPLYIPHLLLNP